MTTGGTQRAHDASQRCDILAIYPITVYAVVLGLGAAMLVALGGPAIFSFGIALLLCAALVAAGAIRAAEIADGPRWLSLTAPVALLVVAGHGVAIGFAMTDV